MGGRFAIALRLVVVRRPRHWSGRQEYRICQSWLIGAFPAVGGW